MVAWAYFCFVLFSLRSLLGPLKLGGRGERHILRSSYILFSWISWVGKLVTRLSCCIAFDDDRLMIIYVFFCFLDRNSFELFLFVLSKFLFRACPLGCFQWRFIAWEVSVISSSQEHIRSHLIRWRRVCRRASSSKFRKSRPCHDTNGPARQCLSTKCESICRKIPTQAVFRPDWSSPNTLVHRVSSVCVDKYRSRRPKVAQWNQSTQKPGADLGSEAASRHLLETTW